MDRLFFFHHVDNIAHYRYILGHLVESKLCRASEISSALGISARNVERYAQKLRQQGIGSFFNQTDHRGECFKMTKPLVDQAQKLLDNGETQLGTANTVGVSESCIRYHLKKGN